MTLEEIVKEHKGLTYGLPMQGYTFSELVYYANILAKQESIEFVRWLTGDNLTDLDYELFQQSKTIKP